jgi:cell division septal protein FtsQ
MSNQEETNTKERKKRKLFILWFILIALGIGAATFAFWPSPKIATVEINGSSYTGS